jgi:hypothetical protein
LRLKDGRLKAEGGKTKGGRMKAEGKRRLNHREQRKKAMTAVCYQSLHLFAIII